MRCLKLTVSYRGTAFCGWQVQPEQPTVQAELEAAFLQITGETIRMTASGRTDSGVHALGQVVSLRTDSTIACDKLLRGLNGIVSRDIAVLSVEEVAESFHAIADAVSKKYHYKILTGPIRHPLEDGFCWHVPVPLEIGQMQLAAEMLLGEHDFACFEATGAPRKSTVRTLFKSELVELNQPPFLMVEYRVVGNGFLYNMVRNIVGTLVEIGRGRQPASWIKQLLAGGDRTLAGETAPAQGLCLMSVEYGKQGAQAGQNP